MSVFNSGLCISEFKSNNNSNFLSAEYLHCALKNICNNHIYIHQHFILEIDINFCIFFNN